MALEDHYKRSAVRKSQEESADIDRGVRERIDALAGEWFSVVGRLNDELAADLQSFVAAMKRHRGGRATRGALPGARHRAEHRPLGLPYKYTWYWSLSDPRSNDVPRGDFATGLSNRLASTAFTNTRVVSAELVVTTNARVAVLDERGRFLPTVPAAMFALPASRRQVPGDPGVEGALDLAKSLRRPPSSDEVSQILAAFLHEHRITL